FPRDYVYALEAPTNYVGPSAIFGNDEFSWMVKDIEDAEQIVPFGHGPSLQVSRLPDSLINALRCFILANAVRDLRGQTKTHRSMLVNVSRFTDVQTQIARLLEDVLRDLQNDI